MNAEQLEKIRIIQNRDHRPKVMAAQFVAGGDRTLIYGYDVERNTFHVYVKDGMLHRFVYRDSRSAQVVVAYEATPTMHGEHMIPNKRIYWEYSDYEAIWFLATLDLPMSFTSARATPEAIAERTPWAGIVYDPEKHTTLEPQSTANRPS